MTIEKTLHTIFMILLISLCANSAAKAENPDKKYNYMEVRKDLPMPDEMVEKCIAHQKAAKEIKQVHPLSFLLSGFSRNGIDISHYQGFVNWDKVATEDISYVYLKATEGASLVDNTYERNLSEAKRVGLKVGSYHFYSTRISIEEQFENLKSHILPSEQDLIPIIDVETRGTIGHESFIRNLRKFLSMVEGIYGKKPIIYTYQNFYNKYLVGEIPEYKLMIACYKDIEMPELNDNKEFVMWQFTSKGRINGIKGGVDRSRLIDPFTLGEILL